MMDPCRIDPPCPEENLEGKIPEALFVSESRLIRSSPDDRPIPLDSDDEDTRGDSLSRPGGPITSVMKRNS